MVVKPKRRKYNPKRQLRSVVSDAEKTELCWQVSYGGKPEHKRNPGNFGLTPPACPRQGKTLCDDAGINCKQTALDLLRKGILGSLVSVQQRKSRGWPQNIWAVSDDGIPLEAQLENPDQGIYHGYPMLENDPFAETIVRAWRQAYGSS